MSKSKLRVYQRCRRDATGDRLRGNGGRSLRHCVGRGKVAWLGESVFWTFGGGAIMLSRVVFTVSRHGGRSAVARFGRLFLFFNRSIMSEPVRFLRLAVRYPVMLAVAAPLFFCLTAAARAEEEKSKAKEPETPAVVKLDGVFESPAAVAVKLGTQEIKSAVIERVIPHGTQVEQGRNVVRFETEEIDRRIRDAEVESRLAEVGLRETEFKHEQFLRSQELERAAAERARRRAQEDHDRFVRVDRDYQVKSAEFSLINAKASLENAQEELDQLEKMYRQDDLTEESEEIVLKRARQAVENARFRLEGSELQTELAIERTIPRAGIDQDDKLARAELSFETTRRELDFAQKRRQLELDKERHKFADQERKLNELREERKRLVIAAPKAGIVFHGGLTRGAIGDKPSTLEPGKSVTADEVVLTIVPAKPLQVRLAVPEANAASIREGMRVRVIPAALPDQSFEGKVKSLSSVPYAAGKFDCVVSVRLGKSDATIVPTMGCRVEFEPASENDAATDSDATQ